MSDKPEQQKQPFTEQDGLIAAELVTPPAPVADDEPPFDPYYDVPPPAEDDYYALPWTPAVMEAESGGVPHRDVPAALLAYGAPALAPVPEPAAPAVVTAAGPLGGLHATAYRVGESTVRLRPADPYGERAHSLNAWTPPPSPVNERQEEPCCTPARPAHRRGRHLGQDPRAHPPHRLPARNPPRDPRPDSRHHPHQQGLPPNA